MTTLAEQILSQHAGKKVTAGEIVIVPIDGTMATDATAPFAIKAFREMGGTRLWDADKVSLIIDHASPAPNERVANLHQMMRDFSREMGCKLYDVGEGICHQLMMENGHVKSGDIFIGADSHTPTLGAIGAFAVGMGSTDVAAVWKTGQSWLKVPASTLITLNGNLAPFVTAKDIILHLVGKLGIAGATYEAIEFTGEAVTNMTLASRMTLTNMVAEMGAKTGMVIEESAKSEVRSSRLTSHFALRTSYANTIELDITALRPQIAQPHSPDKVVAIDKLLGQKIDSAFIGSCTNSRLEDLQMAATVLQGKKIANGMRLVIAPASRHIFNQALADGTIGILSAAGATFITSGCGPCVGTHQGVPANNEVVISSTNRNFQGRMGNPNAQVYLASPAVVAAAALAGEIVDPAEIRD
jgi:3-isopropylmalate/(R)-2-methylmalate dehydratase large subunit